jgi:hypothetical protein
MASTLIVGQSGEMILPLDLRARYGFVPEVPVRIIETRHGIMLVPLTDGPPSDHLAAELAEWQELGEDAVGMFPFDETPA